MSERDERLAAIGRHLRAHPADRYPLEHAAGQFHLGVALADDGRAPDARRALTVAAELFGAAGQAVEEAKARNALGAVLRSLGETDAAADAFSLAAAAFADAGLRVEQGAACFNLGLVHRESGEAAAAKAAYEEARALFEGEAPAGQAAAVARELGSTLLLLGEPDAAMHVLTEALDLAERSGDRAGAAEAANVLGLAHLAAGHTADAVTVLRGAVARHPRTVRAEGHAMALANLALAYDADGDPLRARTAARHALAVAAAPAPVREQAAAILERQPPEPGDAVALLRDEPRDRWPAVVRAEVASWVDSDAGDRTAAAADWIVAEADDEELGPELAHALLGAILELPPDQTERVLPALVTAAGAAAEPAAARFRGHVARALPRFHVPQWKRLEQLLDRFAAEAGQAPWSTS